jgi:predicted alpha/beta hydrolase family esterase
MFPGKTTTLGWWPTAWAAGLGPACLYNNHLSPTGGAFLVAPPAPHGPAFPRQAAATFVEVPALPRPALVMGSTNDPYCSPRQPPTSRHAGRRDGSWWARADASLPSGPGSWQQGHEFLDSLTQQRSTTAWHP